MQSIKGLTVKYNHLPASMCRHISEEFYDRPAWGQIHSFFIEVFTVLQIMHVQNENKGYFLLFIF